MTEETLKKANDLVKRLDKCKENLSKIKYTQSENIVIRESYLKYNGIDGSVVIPEQLFRIIGKIIQSEYIQEINKLKKELVDL